MIMIYLAVLSGLADAEKEGLFQWSDGRPMIYAGW